MSSVLYNEKGELRVKTYGELREAFDNGQLSDKEIYDLVMGGIVDYAKNSATAETKSDILMVLGCSPTPLKGRIVKMMHLYKEGFGKTVLVSGGTGWHGLFRVRDDDKKSFESLKKRVIKYKEMKEALRKADNENMSYYYENGSPKGLYGVMLRMTETDIASKIISASKEIVHIPEDRIILESQSTNTDENFANSRKIIEALQKEGKLEKVKRIMVITSWFHCKRAKMTFERNFAGTGIQALTCPSTLDLEREGISEIEISFDLMNNPEHRAKILGELDRMIKYFPDRGIEQDLVSPKKEEKEFK